MNKLMRLINNYFFDVDSIKGTDGWIYYATLGFGVVASLLCHWTIS